MMQISCLQVMHRQQNPYWRARVKPPSEAWNQLRSPDCGTCGCQSVVVAGITKETREERFGLRRGSAAFSTDRQKSSVTKRPSKGTLPFMPEPT